MDYSAAYLKNELLECRRRSEYAEVILTNLLKLVDDEQQGFIIPFDDLVVTILAAIKTLSHDNESANYTLYPKL